MKIQIKIHNSYGHEQFYPHCENAKKFAELLGVKTLTRDSLKIIKQLGYLIQQVI